MKPFVRKYNKVTLDIEVEQADTEVTVAGKKKNNPDMLNKDCTPFSIKFCFAVAYLRILIAKSNAFYVKLLHGGFWRTPRTSSVLVRRPNYLHRKQDRKHEFLSLHHWSGLINHNTRINTVLPYDNRS